MAGRAARAPSPGAAQVLLPRLRPVLLKQVGDPRWHLPIGVLRVDDGRDDEVAALDDVVQVVELVARVGVLVNAAKVCARAGGGDRREEAGADSVTSGRCENGSGAPGVPNLA